MKDTYIETVNEYLKAIKESKNFGEHIHFINKLFFGYPSLKVDIDILNAIYQNISNELSVPFHDIKLIGSSHIGFSLVKWDCENNVVHKYRPSSDIDIAIINQELFIKMLSATFVKSQAYTDNTSFQKPDFPRQFKNNAANGYIRPDTMGDIELRKNWLRFFKELSLEFNLKISAAVYLNETFFVTKLEKALNTYKSRIEGENENAIE